MSDSTRHPQPPAVLNPPGSGTSAAAAAAAASASSSLQLHRYVTLFVLLGGITGGILLVVSLFIFCKYCRRTRESNATNLTCGRQAAEEAGTGAACSEGGGSDEGPRRHRSIVATVPPFSHEEIATSSRSSRYVSRLVEERRGSTRSRYSLPGSSEGRSLDLDDHQRGRANTPTRAASEEHAGSKQSILLQRQVSVRTVEQPLPLFPRHSNAELNVETEVGLERRASATQVAVEVHHGGLVEERELSSGHVSSGVSFRAASRAGAARIRHNSAGSSSSRGSVRSAGGSIRRDRRGPPALVATASTGSAGEHMGTPPGSPRESPLGSPRRTAAPRRDSRSGDGCKTLQPEYRSVPPCAHQELGAGMLAPLDVVMEWETEQGPPPRRAPSTDWTPLESSLDFWRLEHSRQSRRRGPREDEEDEARRSKVRYNDTGSLEEVNVEEMVDYYVEDEELVVHAAEGDRENLRLQYRRLWELRATFEEDEEEMSDSGAALQGAASTSASSQPPQLTAPSEHTSAEQPRLSQSRSSPDQSPDPDPGTSHTTSFESNTEPLLGDDPARWPPHLLQLPSYESRRQTYKNILTSRLRRMQEARAGPRQPPLENNSFDSLETVDTEGSSTDASRLEQVTTSFESTTDNTDSTGDSQAHKLQQIRADSGYRSFETPARPPKLSHKQIHLADSGEMEELVPPSEQELEECQEVDEGLGGNASPPPSSSQADPSSWEPHRRNSYSRSASKKRREFGRERYTPDSKYFESVNELETDSRSGGESHDESMSSSTVMFSAATSTTAASATVVTTSPGGRATKTVLLPRYLRHGGRYSSVYAAAAAVPQRDYSVDEKSDALFREFSRCDPMFEPPEQSRQRFHYRRLQQHRSSQGSELEVVHQRRSKLSPQDSIDEEYSLHKKTEEDSQMADIPIIRVADEDSSDHI